jgi:pyochelin biosynthetic protein PchC
MQTPMDKRAFARQRGCLRRQGGGEQPQVRLICFPWAGGGASAYRRFASLFPGEIETLAVQYPGREDRFEEDKLLRMDSLVKHVLDDLVHIFDRPLVFFGHSMGALVAYEVAQALKQKSGREPRQLIVSGSGSPDNEGSYERCPADASDDDLISNMQRLGGTPPEILGNKKIVHALLPVLRADYEVLDNYSPVQATRLSCPIIACAGDADPSVSPVSMKAWRQYTTGAYREHWFTGDHFYLNAQPKVLARSLREWVLPSGGNL